MTTDPRGGARARRFDQLSTLLMTVAAVVVAVIVVSRELRARRASRPIDTAFGEPTFMPDWRDLMRSGHVIGDPNARVLILEFADLECPFCRLFHTRFEALRRTRPHDVALVFIHYPLSSHRLAMPAARALECAGAQGRFEEFEATAFENQAQLGARPWSWFALQAGVSDTMQFLRCAYDTIRVSRVEDGLAAGRRIAIHGTPTVIVGGWRFPAPPTDSALAQLVDKLSRTDGATARSGAPPRVERD